MGGVDETSIDRLASACGYAQRILGKAARGEGSVHQWWLAWRVGACVGMCCVHHAGMEQAERAALGSVQCTHSTKISMHRAGISTHRPEISTPGAVYQAVCVCMHVSGRACVSSYVCLVVHVSRRAGVSDHMCIRKYAQIVAKHASPNMPDITEEKHGDMQHGSNNNATCRT